MWSIEVQHSAAVATNLILGGKWKKEVQWRGNNDETVRTFLVSGPVESKVAPFSD